MLKSGLGYKYLYDQCAREFSTENSKPPPTNNQPASQHHPATCLLYASWLMG